MTRDITPRPRGRLRRRVGRTAAFGLAGAALLSVLAGCASSGSPQLTFDGTSCHYDGSHSLSAGPTDLTFRNKSDQYAALAVLQVPDDQTVRTQELDLVGTDFPIPPVEDPNAAQLVGTLLADPGQELTQSASVPAGTFVFDCATMANGQPVHAWRAASIEVKP